MNCSCPGYGSIARHTTECLERQIKELQRKLVGREEALRIAKEKVAYCKALGIEFGIMKTSDKPEGFLQHVYREGSELHRMNKEWMDYMFNEAIMAELACELEEADATICRLCIRLNPQHKDCTSCPERESILAAIAKAKGGT